MVEIEPAQQILVRLALARMHRDHEAGQRFQQLTDAVDRAEAQFFLGDRTLACGIGGPDQIDARRGDIDGFDGLCRLIGRQWRRGIGLLSLHRSG